jgi:hypothetical protein
MKPETGGGRRCPRMTDAVFREMKRRIAADSAAKK